MITPHARDTLTITLQLSGDWTGWTFAGQIRERKDSASDLIKAFTVDATGIAAGTILFTITAANMQTLTPEIVYWFDLRAKNGSLEQTFAQDEIMLDPNVTLFA